MGERDDLLVWHSVDIDQRGYPVERGYEQIVERFQLTDVVGVVDLPVYDIDYVTL